MKLWILVSALLLPAVAMAGPKRVHLVGALYHPIGVIPSKAVATVQLTKPIKVIDASDDSSITYTIASVPQSITLTNPANVSFYLAPNVDATPAGTYYKVTITTNLGQFSQKWEIPNTSNDTRITDVVIVDSPTASTSFLVKTGDTSPGTQTLGGSPAIILPPTTQPTTTAEGAIYNDASSGIRVYLNGAWGSLGSGGGGGGGATTLDGLSDVTITSAAQHQMLVRNASGWVNAAQAGDLSGAVSGSTITWAIGANKITSAMIAPNVILDADVARGALLGTALSPSAGISTSQILDGTILIVDLATGLQARIPPSPGAIGTFLYSDGSSYQVGSAGLSSELLHGGDTPGWGAVPLGALQEVMASTDLSDVSSVTGTGSTLMFNAGPSFATFAFWTDQSSNAGAAGRLQRNGSELSWHSGAAATNLEQVARKNAASGYAGLSGSSKLAASQGQEVWALADLSDVAAKTGTGTTVVMQGSPTLTTPTVTTSETWTYLGLPAVTLQATDGNTLTAYGNLVVNSASRLTLGSLGDGQVAYSSNTGMIQGTNAFTFGQDPTSEDPTPNTLATTNFGVNGGRIAFRYSDGGNEYGSLYASDDGYIGVSGDFHTVNIHNSGTFIQYGYDGVTPRLVMSGLTDTVSARNIRIDQVAPSQIPFASETDINGPVLVGSAGFTFNATNNALHLTGNVSASTFDGVVYSGSATTGKVLTADGSGGSSFQTISGISGLTSGRVTFATGSTTIGDDSAMTYIAGGALFLGGPYSELVLNSAGRVAFNGGSQDIAVNAGELIIHPIGGMTWESTNSARSTDLPFPGNAYGDAKTMFRIDTGDGIVSGAIVAAPIGNFITQLDDAVGAKKFIIQDNAQVARLTVASDGSIAIIGTLKTSNCGTDTISSGATSKTVTMAKDQPTTNYHVSLTSTDANVTLPAYRITSRSTTQFTITCAAASEDTDFTYLVTGY